MNKNASTVIIALLTLIIGFGAGYLASGRGPERGEHRMANGQMMENGAMTMGSAMDDMMSGLRGKTGDDFDREFLAEMIVHHQGAVDMAQAALRDAKHEEIKQMASAIITAQTAEIRQMQGWQKSWYGN